MELDLLDRKLIYALDVDARRSYAQLAKEIGTSQEVVRYRMQRLIDNKIIQYFVTVVDIAKIGFYHYETQFRFQKLSEEKEKELIDYLKSLDNILWLASCTGEFDLIFSTIAKSNIHFSEILSKITEKYGEFIAERNVQMTIRLPHFTRAFLLPNKEIGELDFGSIREEYVEIDRIDFRILRIIMDKGRMPVTEIAEKIRSTVDVVKYRLRKLRKDGVIQTCRPLLNKEKYGFLLSQMLFSFRSLDESLKRKFIHFCKELKYVTFVFDTIGRFDLIVELEPPTQRIFDELLRKIRNEFSDYITDYATLSITKEHQMHYFKVDEEEYFNK